MENSSVRLKYFDQPESAGKLAVCTLSLLLLFPGFFSNYWHVAEQQWFLHFQRGSESLVVGRLVKSRQDGIFSAGGLTGAGIPHRFADAWLSPDQVDGQYSAYFNGSAFKRYEPYLSQTGGQGIFFSLLDSRVPLSPQTKLKSFYMLTSFLSAAALTLIILWFYCEFGLIAAVFTACSMVLSQWLTVFGRNLWWSIWAFYMPMIAVMYFLRYKRTYTNHYFITFGIVIFISVFVKCLINGYEFMTTTLIMMMIPFVYYAVADRLGVRRFFKGTLMAVCGSLIAVFLSFMILSVQIAAVKGNMLDGIKHVVFSFAKRTHGDPYDYPHYATSLDSSTVKVTITYLKGTFFDVNNYLHTSHPFVSWYVFKIRYVYLIGLFLVMSVLLLYKKDNTASATRRQRNIAIVSATWVSILAPLSWYVIFKAHSFVHTFMNNIVWQMPFTFFGFAVCGLAVRNALSGKRK